MIRKFTTILAVLATSAAFAQEAAPAATPAPAAPAAEFKVKNTPYATIFATYGQQYRGDSLATNAMLLDRAYLGFKSEFAENWSGDVKIDLLKEQLENGTTPTGKPNKVRATYIKEAYVKYSKNKFALMAGIVPTAQTNYQLKHWGNRYISNTATDINKVGVASADIGIVADYKINDMFSADFSVYNGEGFSSVQIDKEFTQMLGVSAKLPAGIIARVYGSYTSDTVLRERKEIKNAELIYGGLVGIKTLEDKLTFGAEYSHADKWKNIDSANADIISVYAMYEVTPKIQCFVRGDNSSLKDIKTANKVKTISNETSNVLYLCGAQYRINKNVRLSLDYQRTEKKSDKEALNGFYIHSEFKF